MSVSLLLHHDNFVRAFFLEREGNNFLTSSERETQQTSNQCPSHIARLFHNRDLRCDKLLQPLFLRARNPASNAAKHPRVKTSIDAQDITGECCQFETTPLDHPRKQTTQNAGGLPKAA